MSAKGYGWANEYIEFTIYIVGIFENINQLVCFDTATTGGSCLKMMSRVCMISAIQLWNPSKFGVVKYLNIPSK